MIRYLIVLVLVTVVVGMLWPQLTKLGLGRLPGDITIQRKNADPLYMPVMTCIVLSLVFSALLWLFVR
jgi:hypothetical protein